MQFSFLLRRGNLYSFWGSNSAEGRSGGFPAAGEPDCAGREDSSSVEGPTQKFANYGSPCPAYGSVRWTPRQSKDLGLYVVLEGLNLRKEAVAGTTGQSSHFSRFVQQYGHRLAQFKLQPIRPG